jgi:hypothetical protein
MVTLLRRRRPRTSICSSERGSTRRSRRISSALTRPSRYVSTSRSSTSYALLPPRLLDHVPPLPHSSGSDRGSLSWCRVTQEEALDDFVDDGVDDLVVSLYQMDLDRTLFLLRSYLLLEKVSRISQPTMCLFLRHPF